MSEGQTSVLVVDDDVDTCRNLSDILTDLGYHVDTAHDGPSALELARRRPYDLALLDLKMPGMDGLELYRELRKLRADAVALIVTAFAGPDTEAEAAAAGVWRVLRKPVDFPVLLKLLGEAADQPLLLAVLDDPDLCTSLWSLLRGRGYRVGLAHDEATALERLKDRSFRVVLIDVQLAADADHLVQRVRDANPEARTVLVAGPPGEGGPPVEQALAEGADAVCFKPFDVPRLLDTLQQLTAERGAS